MRFVCLAAWLVSSLALPALAAPNIILPSGVTVAPGQQVNFPVSLAEPAPAGGAFILLTTSDPSTLVVAPAAVFIGEGATAARPVKVTGVSNGVASVIASAANFELATKTVVVGTSVSSAITFSPQTLTITKGSSQNATLLLSAPAPAGGQPVNLTSDNPSVAQVQPSAGFFSAGTSSNVFSIVGIGAGTTTIHAGYAPALGDTTLVVTVTSAATPPPATPGTITLPSGVSLTVGQSAAFPLTLSTAAPSGGLTVSLTSSDPSKVAITPSTVSILAGYTSPTVQPQVTGVGSGSAIISASASGYTAASQTVQSQAAQSNPILSFAPATLPNAVVGANSLQLNLSSAAPASGLTVSLVSSNAAAATVPATVSFAANTSIVSVPVTGVAAGLTTIFATAPNATGASATVTVVAPSGGGGGGGNGGTHDINLPSGLTVGPGQQVKISVTLAKPAPSGGVFITLSSSDNSKLTVYPANILIPEGQTTTNRQAQLTGGDAGSATITASAMNMVGDSQVVLIGTAQTLAPSTMTINGIGSSQNLTISLTSPAPSYGLTFTLSSSNPGVASVPGSLTFNSNTTTMTFPVTGAGAGTAVIHASSMPSYADVTSTVTVVGGGTIGLPAGTTVGLGQAISFPVTLGSPAPTGGVTVSLSSNDPSRVNISPSGVFISGGLTSPAQQPLVTGLALGSATISASAPGYTSASQTVQVAGSMTFAPPSLNVSSLGQQSLALTLSGPAPAGLTAFLTSSNPNMASVPSTVTFGTGATSANVPVNVLGVGSATITASATNMATATASVSMAGAPVAGGSISLPAGVSLSPNQAAPFPLTLSVPAPAGGLTVYLSSSSSVLTVTSSVYVAAGNVSPATQPQITGVAFGSATITASAAGYTSASQSVQVSAKITFSPTTLNVTGYATTSLQLNLSTAAPAAGLTVNLSSSNPSVATVLSTITFPANVSSVSVPISTVGAGSTTIHASALPSIADTTATVNVTVASSSGIGLPNNATTSMGQLTPFPITLNPAAPAGGLSISFASSDDTKLIVTPATIYIPAGATTAQQGPYLYAISPGTVTLTATASVPGYGTATVTATATASTATVTWGGACWYRGTFYGYTGNFQAVTFGLSTTTPVTLQGSLFFTANCQPGIGYDNLNDYGYLTYGGGLQGFTHYPDTVPSSAMFWIGPRTVDGMCPPGVPCSGCLRYDANTPMCGQ